MTRSPLRRRFALRLLIMALGSMAIAGCGAGPSPLGQSDRPGMPPAESADGATPTPDPAADVGSLDPNGFLRSLSLPVPVTAPDGAEISSVEVFTWGDETGREVHRVSIELSSPETIERLTDALARRTILPERGIDIPLPSPGDFYDWSNPATRIEPTDEGSVATVSTETRRQRRNLGTGIIDAPMTDPLRQLADDPMLPAFSSASTVAWRPETPDQVDASLSLLAIPESRPAVIEWLRSHSRSGSFRSDFANSDRDDRVDGAIETVLAGEPPVTATFRTGSYRDQLHLRFSYPIDADGAPLPLPSLARIAERPTLVGWGSTWRLDDDGAMDQGWFGPDFDDAAWSVGDGPFVRNEPDVAPSTVNTPTSGMPAWFRHSFDIDDPSAVASLDLSYVADDGVLILLNGEEIHRWNLPEGSVGPGTVAVDRISGDDEDLVRVVTGIPASHLTSGQNVLAVAVLQASSDSDDTRFDLQVEGVQGNE